MRRRPARRQAAAAATAVAAMRRRGCMRRALVAAAVCLLALAAPGAEAMQSRLEVASSPMQAVGGTSDDGAAAVTGGGQGDRSLAHHRPLFGGLAKDRLDIRHSARGVLVRASACGDDILSLGPWVAIECWRDARMWHESFALLGSGAYTFTPTGEDVTEYLGALRLHEVLGILIFCTGVAFFVWSLKDVHRFVMLLAQKAVERQQKETKAALAEKEAAAAGAPRGEVAEGTDSAKSSDLDGAKGSSGLGVPQRWPVMAIVGLTSYRFYTGFLSATWLPYLLAMEGQELWPEQQSIFMGFAKLIYGATILLNPVFGRIGDHAVALSHGVGRRLFVRLGITLAALGIYICVLSAQNRFFLSFLSGVLLWRLGEALNDVTTEALVPEMVPQEQYQVASGIKASSFLLGGLFGYILLLVYSDAHYSWLYYAYPIGMFTCALPALFLLDKDHPFPPSQQQKRRDAQATQEESFCESLATAYLTPMAYEGGFPRACLAVFIFGLGTSPMFFLLLIVRDLVGIRDPVAMQRHFSIGSICFFLAAALASVIVALASPARRQQTLQQEQQESEQVSPLERQVSNRTWAAAELLEQRGRWLTKAMCVFGVIVLSIPSLAFFQERHNRQNAYYLMISCFGFSFGVSFSLFQDLTWQMLPPDVNFATAMGFNVMSRLAGVGLGNFLCGVILDMSFRKIDGMVVYNVSGYIIMCTFSGIAVLISTRIASTAINQAQETDMETRAKQTMSQA